jgi:PAS domain-containing protein
MTQLDVELLIVIAVLTATLAILVIREAHRARGERAIRQSEERFRRSMDRAPVMLWTARADTTLDFLNQNCVEFTGLPIEKLLNEGWLDAVHPDDRDNCVGIYGPESRRYTISLRVPSPAY